MAEEWQIQRQQRNAIERLEKGHQNALARQQHNQEQRQAIQREAVIIEGENAETLMNLKHELDKENRLLDHAFNVAEDAREVERLATEISMRRRDDFIRQQWENEGGLHALEAKVIFALANGAIADRQSRVDHSHVMDAKQSDQNHDLVMEREKRVTMTHENELDKDNFDFKERLKVELHGQSRSATTDDVAKIVKRLRQGER